VKRLLLFLVAVGLVLGTAPVFAQEEATPTAEKTVSAGREATAAAKTPTPAAVKEAPPEYLYPGILPDHPLYFLKALLYKIRGFFVFGDLARARWQMKMADKRAAEAKALAKKGRYKLAKKALERAVIAQEKAVEHLERAKKKGKKVENLVERLEKVSIRQQAALDRVLEKVPEEAKEAILKAKERSKKGHRRAIEVLKRKVEKVKEGREESE